MKGQGFIIVFNSYRDRGGSIVNIDDEIVTLIKNKNPLGLERLIEKYTSSVYSLIFRIIGSIGSREDIEECASDVFAEAWNCILDFNSKRGSFKTWILIKTKYKALEYRRRLIRLSTKQYLPSENEIIECANSRIDKTSVEEEVLKREKLKHIVDTVNELNELDRKIFNRRYFLYEDIESIANRYSLTRQAVDNRLLRCRKKLKSMIIQEQLDID